MSPRIHVPMLEVLLAEPFPHTPQAMMQLEQRLSTAAAQTADQILLVQVTRAHEDEAFVRQAIAQARAQRAVPLVHKGLRTTSTAWQKFFCGLACGITRYEKRLPSRSLCQAR